MNLEDSDIRKVTEQIWSTTLGLNLVPMANPSILEEGEFLTGCVSIVGEWTGLTVLHCSSKLARTAARIMFGCDEPHPEEVRDAFSELVNMTGGNIKPLLGSNCELSLPSIIEGKDHLLSIPGTELLSRLYFESEGQPLEVLLLHRKV